MSTAELARAREAVVRHAVGHGIASVHEMNGPDQMGRQDFDAWVGGAWPIDVVGYWGGFDLTFAAERDLRQVGGDLLLDGSLGSHTAALGQPYADDPLDLRVPGARRRDGHRALRAGLPRRDPGVGPRHR